MPWKYNMQHFQSDLHLPNNFNFLLKIKYLVGVGIKVSFHFSQLASQVICMLIVVTKVDLNALFKDVWHIFQVCYQFPKLGTDTYYTSLHVLVAEAWQEKYLETDFGALRLFPADPKTFSTVFFCNHFIRPRKYSTGSNLSVQAFVPPFLSIAIPLFSTPALGQLT